ncbi:MAG: hypothetical protein Q7U20_02170 [Caulobacter sp.]|nr:hypothetical protein [Caulobacter sp.]
MTFRLAALAVLLAVCAPVTAFATDYRVMGEDERAISLIEGAVKTDSDGHRETVFFIAFSTPVGGPGGTQVVSSTILFDCGGARYKVGASSKFTAEMTPIERGTVQYGWRDVVPDSPFSRAGAYACKGVALPKADAGEVKAIVAGYLARRAAAAPPPTAEAAPVAPVVAEPAAAEPAPT